MKRIVSAFALVTAIASAATIATVNGEKIDSEEINLVLSRNGVTYEHLNDEQKKQIVDQAIEQKLLVQAAKKAGTDKSDEYKRAVSVTQEGILVQLYVQNKLKALNVSDSDVKKFYKDKEKELTRPEEVCARHILVESEGDAKAIIAELSKKKDKEVLPEFEKLAKEKSKDGSAANGGDLGCFTKEKMVTEFAEAAFKQKTSTVSKAPVKSDFGYHIIYVSDHKKAGVPPFDEVKEQLKNYAKQEKFQEIMEKEVKDLRAKAKITE